MPATTGSLCSKSGLVGEWPYIYSAPLPHSTSNSLYPELLILSLTPRDVRIIEKTEEFCLQSHVLPICYKICTVVALAFYWSTKIEKSTVLRDRRVCAVRAG